MTRPVAAAFSPQAVAVAVRGVPAMLPAGAPRHPSNQRTTRMNDLNVIDRFMQGFVTYIDNGFGLLGPDVGFLTSVLIGIDITLAGLFWALGGEDNVIGRFLKKILYVGAFALILNSFSTLADIIFRSFAQAGLTAGGGVMLPDDLLKPGRLAATGFEAAWPLLDQASEMVGFTTFFDNFLTIMILLLAWAIIIIAFFILAVQMFVCILEFKLVSLAGFILVPFALWNRTSFLAERVLGHVVSSGIKVMVLAVIVGIGTGLFSQFTSAYGGGQPTIEQALSVVLAALAMLGLGIFGPGIATGLVSGAPQLGAGAVVGTGLAVAGTAMAGSAAFGLAGRGATAAASGSAAAARGGAAMAGGMSSAYSLASAGRSGAAGVASGLGGAGRAAASAAAAPVRRAAAQAAGAMRESFASGTRAGVANTGGSSTMGTIGSGEAANDRAASQAASESGPPAWAQRVKRNQAVIHGAQTAAQALKSGDSHGGGHSVDLSQGE